MVAAVGVAVAAVAMLVAVVAAVLPSQVPGAGATVATTRWEHTPHTKPRCAFSQGEAKNPPHARAHTRTHPAAFTLNRCFCNKARRSGGLTAATCTLKRTNAETTHTCVRRAARVPENREAAGKGTDEDAYTCVRPHGAHEAAAAAAAASSSNNNGSCCFHNASSVDNDGDGGGGDDDDDDDDDNDDNDDDDDDDDDVPASKASARPAGTAGTRPAPARTAACGSRRRSGVPLAARGTPASRMTFATLPPPPPPSPTPPQHRHVHHCRFWAPAQ